MAKNYGTNLNLNKYELQNARIQNLAADPASPVVGQIYYNTVTNKKRTFNGATWDEDGTGSSTGDVTGPVASVDNELPLFSGTTGKVIKRSTASGIPKLTSGVVSVATPGTDYTTPSSTESFTNKTFNANGTGNAITNIETADFALNVIDTDVALTANSDTRLATQKAVKAYVDALLNAQDALVFKGGIDCSTNPNYPAASAGFVYKVTVAGLIGGVSGIAVTAGDTLYCTVDGSAAGNHSTVGANWVVVQANVDAATTTTQGVVELATLAEAEAKTDAVRALTAASIANFTQKKTFTIGDGVATSFGLTHNLNTLDISVSIRKVSTGEQWEADITCNTVNQVTIGFVAAPTSNEYVVTVIG